MREGRHLNRSFLRGSLLAIALWQVSPGLVFAQSSSAAPDGMDAWRTRLNERLDQTLERLSTAAPEPPAALVAKLERPALPGLLPQLPARRSEPWLPAIPAILGENGLPPQLMSVAEVESGFNPAALSPKGARGLWQLMPETARRYGLVVDSGRDERLDPMKSTSAAARYLRDLYTQFQDWPLALAAYNAGENRVQRSLDRLGAQDFWTLSRSAALPEETRRYVPAVLAKVRVPLVAPLLAPHEEDPSRSRQLDTPSSPSRIVYASATPAH